MTLFGETLPLATASFLLLALFMALSFEFVNGFHDTANAVATVIYTHSLRPSIAVVWSGLWNLTGVLLSSGAVAFAIVSLLPVELVLNVGSGAGFAMVFALLISAIIWNVGTWYLGLPASSSHTLIGSIMGVGLANSLVSPGHVFGEGVNWAKAQEVFSTLLISPIVGFVCSAILLLLVKLLIRKPELFQPADATKSPPWWIRSILILTCTGVSFAHGSNDGQKGMGLIMLILIGILPAVFAVNLGISPEALRGIQTGGKNVAAAIDKYVKERPVTQDEAKDELSSYLKTTGKLTDKTLGALSMKLQEFEADLQGKSTFRDLDKGIRSGVRSDIYLVQNVISKLNKQHQISDPADAATLGKFGSNLTPVTNFIPPWVKVAVALALGCGTMIGWKRIVVTVGEKIGKAHLSYAQGAAAELVAMGTIFAADNFGLPVSTTHVLSSGIAGTMAANRSGLQMQTLRNIALAWILTLPACVLLGAGTFSAGLFIVFNVLGWK
ncbi:MAG: inorganic phosphate transporter [Verrucomicrobia bacterium]|nr:inorganic phosphate transporter [Verrucomicrobiota bacterium]